MSKYFFSLFCLTFIGVSAFSQTIKSSSGGSSIKTSQLAGGSINTITTAVPFLTISPDSRAGGMGDAGVASTPDINSMHWNASKYAFMEKNMGLGINYTPWLRALVPDINLAYLSGYKKIDKAQVLAASLRYFSLGTIQFTDEQGNNTGQFNPNEFSLDVAYARKLSENFAAGLAMRYVYSNLTGGLGLSNGAKAGMTAAADISMTYKKPVQLGAKKSNFVIGANISNIGAKLTYSTPQNRDFIPTNLRTGVGLHLNLDDYNKLNFILDINKLLVPKPPVKDYRTNPATIIAGKDNNIGVVSGILQYFYDAPGGPKEELHELIYAGGLEYWYDNLFAFRGGMFFEDKTKGNRQYVTFGAGLRYNVFGIDLSYLAPINGQQSPLQNTLRFTLTFDFDAFKVQNGPTTEE
ncbi:MAG: type IX secretion system outer membrane channel protein PorV [Bacteroidia bacterium]|nr:type IX secretion system outer membrane channel protein PorV [Bacteroidia bacterium]